MTVFTSALGIPNLVGVYVIFFLFFSTNETLLFQQFVTFVLKMFQRTEIKNKVKDPDLSHLQKGWLPNFAPTKIGSNLCTDKAVQKNLPEWIQVVDSSLGLQSETGKLFRISQFTLKIIKS
jgi:hypothetical protein